MEIKELANKIMSDKIKAHIRYRNFHYRPFDSKTDLISISLTEKQWDVIKRGYNLKSYRVIGVGVMFETFTFDDYKIIKVNNNTRMNCIELLIKHKDYIEDDDIRMEYEDERYENEIQKGN